MSTFLPVVKKSGVDSELEECDSASEAIIQLAEYMATNEACESGYVVILEACESVSAVILFGAGYATVFEMRRTRRSS